MATQGAGDLRSIQIRRTQLQRSPRQQDAGGTLNRGTVHDGVEVGKHRIDLFVADEIVVDLKAISELHDVHFAIVRSQLRAVKRKHGLLLNFAKIKLEAKRVIAE